MAFIGNNNLISVWRHETDGWYNRQSNSWGEISSDYRISISPYRSDSKLILEATLPSQRGTHHGLNHYKWYNITDSNDVNSPNVPSGQSRAKSHCSSRGSHNEDNAVVNVIRTMTDSFSGTKTFGIYAKSWNSDVIRHNHSAGNSNSEVHWSSNMVIIVYEVEDI